MTKNDERIFDFIMENDAPTAELFKAALAAMPDLRDELHDYFREWVWMEWYDANIDIDTAETVAEREAWVNKGMMRFWEKMAELEGRLLPPGKC